jgi:hypothetical protein
MLDGRVDIQGTVEVLKAKQLVEALVDKAHAETEREGSKDGEITDSDANGYGQPLADPPTPAADRNKRPRKLVKDEHREVGSVKWATYDSYLRAS